MWCASRLSALCLLLSPLALAIIFWYSLAKRFTSYTQMFLGLAMAVAPVGGWLAAGGQAGWEPWLSGLAIGSWVGGFDVLYACQDLEVDRREGLRSIPVRFGVRRALVISRAMHVVTVACLAALGVDRRPGPDLFRRRDPGRGPARVGTVARERARPVPGQTRLRYEWMGWHAVSGDDGRGGPLAMHLATIAVGVTGASGAIYALRTIAALLEEGCRLEVVFSDYGRRLLLDELGEQAKVERLVDLLVERYGEGVRRGELVRYSNKDLGAPMASGSHQTDAMVVVPCSMKTLAGVAHGLSRNLIERAADVMLKERRRLVLVPRETPMSLPALKNLVAAAEAGALILPAMPAFYQRPATIDDLAAFMAGKILNALGFEQRLFPAWAGE